MTTNKKWLFLALFLCFFYLLVLQVIAVWPYTIDDMYISLRYAKNWVDGYGLIWNLGDEPVEGYSNFSFVVLAALAIRMGLDPVVLLKAVNVISLLFSSLAIYCLSRFWFRGWLATIPCLWMLAYRGEIIWSVSGLETIFYQALICFSLFFLLRGMGYCLYPEPRKKPSLSFFAISGFLLAMAGLTRPEAPALMILFAALALLDSPKEMKGDYYKKLLAGCLVCIAIFLPYFLWRWHYYGRLFPNPVYCKGISDFFWVLNRTYLTLALPFFFLSLVAMHVAEDKRHYFFWLPSLVYLALLAHADPVSALDNRLFLPVFVLLLPLAFSGLATVLDYFVVEKDLFYYACLLMLAFWIAFLFLKPSSLKNYRYFTINPVNGYVLRNKVLAWLNHNAPANSPVVLADSGQIPYLSPLPYLDSYCLNNKAMTTIYKNDMYQGFCSDVMVRKPPVVILTSLIENDGNVIYAPVDACLKEHFKNDSIYKFQRTYEVKSVEFIYRYEIYVLRGRTGVQVG
ncbi:hypothetical protein BN59_03026 [Legionella massiliensis]|uniref:Glycosyltransferase RgtA/B/C/D-like domain-containing protein n=1 Tax=Legionella massiliensis TaxID=1034943 RepID=A0A078L3L3_9GAMM|nr:hypothetical protein [Legionella massiliensis]CDZ78714.1 hypothetical protein BN59_03026 [Legionella massiliensis]CEE14452.1 hypothetical protein BN1094_03026 [Legionella massiliensis]